jgi:hypothetical protein
MHEHDSSFGRHWPGGTPGTRLSEHASPLNKPNPTPPFVQSKFYFEQISQKCILLMVVDALFCI